MHTQNVHDPHNFILSKKTLIGEPPGSLNYSGLYNDEDIIIDLIIYNKDHIEQMQFENIDTILSNGFKEDSIYWINITGLHNMELIKKIGDFFGIHPIDLEDIVHISQWSKIEKKDTYLFSIFKMVYLKNESIIHEHVSMILKENILLTFQETPGDVFDYVRERLVYSIGKIRNMEIDFLYYSLIDALVDPYFLIINKIATSFNEIELAIINEKTSDIEIYKLRKELVYLANAITPIHNALKTFFKTENTYFHKAIIPYYSDVMDHLNQIIDSIKAYREIVNSLYEMKMANVNNGMNKIMMTLTIFSVIFIPLSFLAGFFGMNFNYIPGLNMHSGIYIFIALCLIIAIGMVSYFKIKKWF